MFNTNLGRVIIATITLVASMPIIAKAGTPQEETERAFALINEERAKVGAAPLTSSTGAMKDATATRAYEASFCSDHKRADGTEWYTLAPDILYGENLADNFDKAEDVVSAWMNSPIHKNNIVNKDFKTTSIQIYVTSDNKWYWAEEFGY